MKIRFTSKKERQPTTDEGLKVIYAPGKRMAYRLRWYLILLLVASPVLWFAGHLLGSMLVLEAPARIFQPLTEVRAMESGMVSQVHVKLDQQVLAGSLLVALENPGLTAQQQALNDALQVSVMATTPVQRQEQLLQQQIVRAQRRADELQRLVSSGAATRGELDQARDVLDDRLAALAGFQRSLEPTAALQHDVQRNRSELVALEKRLEQLQVRAVSEAIVRDVNVHEGEVVGPGTLMMRLHTSKELEIQVFLDARQRELARPGQALKLRMPDHSWLDATVIAEPRLVSRLPQDMRSPFGSNDLGIMLTVATVEPLPNEWQLDNLQMTARFPNRIQRWLQD